jgi:hypothetical protein
MLEPWSKFFWSDYEADEGLRVCSLAAQGLWMRMLCLMARATPKGELRIAGEPCTTRDLSKLVSEGEETVAALLEELRRRGVFSVTRAGVIFSRRIRKDAEISRKRAESGAKGGRASLGNKSANSDLLEQKSSKHGSKTEALEARSQKLEEEREEEPPTPIDPEPPGAGGGKYAFAGRTIRLNAADLGEWRKAFHAIPDLNAELYALDGWWQRQDEPRPKNWFYRTSQMLNRKHQESVATRKSSGGGNASGNDYLDHMLAQDAERAKWRAEREAREAGNA